MTDADPKKDVEPSQSSSPDPGAKSMTPPPNPQETVAVQPTTNGHGAGSRLAEELAAKLRERDEKLEDLTKEVRRLRELREAELRKPGLFKPGFKTKFLKQQR